MNKIKQADAKWEDVQKVLPLDSELFKKRMRVLAGFIDNSDKSVIDFGAGAEYLRKLLAPDVKYYPIDYEKRSERTILCDINKDDFPDINADVAFMAGFIGYCDDIDSVLTQATKHVRKIIISHKGKEKFSYSQLYSQDIIDILYRNDFILTKRSFEYSDDWVLLGCFEKKAPSLIEKNDFCTGCGACRNICPTNAISMVFNEGGFYHPAINNNSCMNCAKCCDACPTLIYKENTNTLLATYAAIAEDKIRIGSSSGGAFSVFAKKIIKDGGVVFGAAWTEDFYIKHIGVTEEKELNLLRKSKYAQSDVSLTFQEAKNALDAGKKVLYCGTPCQIAGFKSFLGLQANNESLLAIDFVCFCSPSIVLFREYLEQSYGIKNISEINFRHKHNGWSPFGYQIKLKDGSILYPTIGGIEKDTYQSLFHSVAARNDVCENCKFADFPRQGDISLGDFWGIEQHDASLNDGKGTSLILVNNENASKFLASVSEDFAIIKQVPDEWARGKGNRIGNDGRKSSDGAYKRLMQLKRSHSLKECAEQILKHKHDIGMVCLLNWNYGNNLTNWSLYRTVTNLGYSTLLIDIPNDCIMANDFKNVNATDKFSFFIKNPYPEYDVLVNQSSKIELSAQNNLCSMFMVASDQIFRSIFIENMGFHSVCDWIHSNKYKFSYGTSFATDHFEGTDELKIKVSFFLKRFQKISVREESSVNLLRDEFGVEGKFVLDPVFLTRASEYSELAKVGRMTIPDVPYMGAYILDPTEERADLIRTCSASLGTKQIFSATDSYINDKAPWSLETHLKIKNEEWLSMIENCEFFITDSFHGMCFAIIFNKPFVVVFNKWQWRGEERIKSLAKLLHLEDRIVSSLEEILESDLLNTPIDYDSVNKILDIKREECLEWLKSCIEEGKSFEAAWNSYDFILENEKREVLFRNNILSRIDSLEQKNAEVKDLFMSKLAEFEQKTTELKSEFEADRNSYMQRIQELENQLQFQKNLLNENQELILNTRHRTLYGACAWLFHKIFRR